MKKNIFIVFVLLGFIFTFGSCANIRTFAYGASSTITNPTGKTENWAREYNIPLRDWFDLDISYLHFMLAQDRSVHFYGVRSHTQMLQALYFDRNGDLVSFFSSAYASGFPNLRWNRNNELNTFVPQTQAPIENALLNFDQLRSFLNEINYTEQVTSSEYDYIVVVFWADAMGRQSRRFIRFIQQNVALAQENQRVRIIYVNMDRFRYDIVRSRQE